MPGVAVRFDVRRAGGNRLRRDDISLDPQTTNIVFRAVGEVALFELVLRSIRAAVVTVTIVVAVTRARGFAVAVTAVVVGHVAADLATLAAAVFVRTGVEHLAMDAVTVAVDLHFATDFVVAITHTAERHLVVDAAVLADPATVLHHAPAGAAVAEAIAFHVIAITVDANDIPAVCGTAEDVAVGERDRAAEGVVRRTVLTTEGCLAGREAKTEHDGGQHHGSDANQTVHVNLLGKEGFWKGTGVI